MAKVESVEQAVGRLMSARLPSISLSQDDEKALKEWAIGGIVLFKENGTNSDQVIDLIDQVNNLSLHQPILSVDQEGGAVQRFDHFLTPIPSAMALAASSPR